MKIVVSGKGGVGKTTLAGTLAMILAEEGYEVIAVDSDPSMNLHTAIGIENPTPVSKLREVINARTVVSPGIYNLNPDVGDILEKYSSKNGRIRLIVMGTVEKGGEGCVCPENTFLRALLRHIAKRDEVIILDTEAGIEHLGRKTAEGFNLMLVVCEPSMKAIETANRIYELGKDVGIKRIYAVGNKVSSAAQEKLISGNINFEVVAYIPFDENVLKADMSSVPLFALNSESPAVEALIKIKNGIKGLLHP